MTAGGQSRARVLLGRATSVDFKAQRVSVMTPEGQTETLAYDHLLLGTGSSDPFDKVPGLREYGWRLKDTRDMQRFQAHLFDLVGAAGGADRSRLAAAARVLVIGGGFAGVEMAGAIRDPNWPARVRLARGAALDLSLMTSPGTRRGA